MNGGRVRETLKICTIIAATAIVVAAAVPVTVDAAGSFVTIQDDDTTENADVERGKLHVGDGQGPITVDGTVATHLEPYSRWRTWRRDVGGFCQVLVSPRTGKAAVISSISLDFWQNDAEPTDIIALHKGTTCNALYDSFTPPQGGLGHVSVDYDPGLSSKSGFSLSRINGDPTAYVLVLGYEIPATDAPPE